MDEAPKQPRQTTSAAKDVHFDGQKPNKLDQTPPLSRTFAETQKQGGHQSVSNDNRENLHATSVAKQVNFDNQKPNKLDQTASLSKEFTQTQKQGGNQVVNNDHQEKGQGTSFAKSVQFEHGKKNQLEQIEHLRQVYGRAKDKGINPDVVKSNLKAIGPQPDAAKHLRLPDSVERRIVDAQIHNEQLAQGREAARKRDADQLKEVQSKIAEAEQTKSRGKTP